MDAHEQIQQAQLGLIGHSQRGSACLLYTSLTNGIIKENPVLRLVLGTCSILAVTTAVSSALGMGAAFTFVLVLSLIHISW